MKTSNYILLALLAIIVFLTISLRNHKQKTSELESLNNLKDQQIKSWIDKEGVSRARANASVIDAKNARKLLDKELQKKIKKEVGNIKRNLISYSEVKSSTTGLIKTKAKDTVYVINNLKELPVKNFEINNKDLIFNGRYNPSNDSLIADYKVIHNFDFIYYYRKPGKSPWNLFCRKQAVSEIKFYNKNSKADSIYTIVLKRERSLLSKILGINKNK